MINESGFPPTFRNRGSACLDVTLASSGVRAVDWSAAHDLTSSDHAVISFDLLASETRPEAESIKSVRYNWKQTNWAEFRKTLKHEAKARVSELQSPDADTYAEALSEVLTKAYTTHMRQVAVGRHKPPPCWNEHLGRELRALGRWKVRLRDAKNALRRRALHTIFVRKKSEHKRSCFKARRAAWRKFVTDTGNREPWGPVQMA